MLRAIIGAMLACLTVACSTNTRSDLPTILAATAKGAETACPGFARASRTPLGNEADVAAIRQTIREYTHDAGFVAEIRWLSRDRAVAAVVENPYFNLGMRDYCCKLKRSQSGHWVVASYELTEIA